MPPGTQIDKTTCFPFRKAGGFLCLLRLLPQAPCGQSVLGNTENFCGYAIENRCRWIKRVSPLGRAAIRSLYAVLGSIILFIKLRQQHIHMGSGEVIEESFLGFLGQFFLQFCFWTNFVESVYAVNMEAFS